MIKKFYQAFIPLLILKTSIFILKFSCKVLQNLELKIENSEKLEGKNILLDSLIELLSTLKQSFNKDLTTKTILSKNQTIENNQIIQK